MYATTASSRFNAKSNARRPSVLAWLRRMFELSGQPYADGVLPPL